VSQLLKNEKKIASSTSNIENFQLWIPVEPEGTYMLDRIFDPMLDVRVLWPGFSLARYMVFPAKSFEFVLIDVSHEVFRPQWMLPTIESVHAARPSLA
jgi:hypothetical protein